MNQSGLSAAELLEVVDAGADGDAAVRGGVLLAAAAPEVPIERLAELVLGERDAHILGLRCATFGDTLRSRVTCPACGSLLTVKIPRQEVTRRIALNEPERAPTVRIEEGPFLVEARSPDGQVLTVAAACPDEDSARRALISGCVTVTATDGGDIDPLELESELLERIGEAIVAADPQAEVGVTMDCAGCGNEWTAILDISQFFWREISTTSVQLLDEVHQLAIGYGWSEEQVLRLPSRRRRDYVERLAGA